MDVIISNRKILWKRCKYLLVFISKYNSTSQSFLICYFSLV
nr:MAG TPA: hypothetical protein [Caudoviricetes sp.]